jgi:hypothetical protein
MGLPPMSSVPYQRPFALDSISSTNILGSATFVAANSPHNLYGTPYGPTSVNFDSQPLHQRSPVVQSSLESSLSDPRPSMGGGPLYPQDVAHGQQFTDTWDESSLGLRECFEVEPDAGETPAASQQLVEGPNVLALGNVEGIPSSQGAQAAEANRNSVEVTVQQQVISLEINVGFDEDDDQDEYGGICSNNIRNSEQNMRTYLFDGVDRVTITPPRKRGAFGDEKTRKETARTRHSRACLRCRNQKIRCVLDPNDPDGDCLPCKKWNPASKKTLHRVPCCRFKLTDSTIYREGGLNLTTRWTGTEMKDVADRNKGEVRTIDFTLGVCNEPLKVQVVRFQPIPGDITCRSWTVYVNGQEVKRTKPLAPYCLADIRETARYFRDYINKHAISAFAECAIPSMPQPEVGPQESDIKDNVIQRTYQALLEHHTNVQKSFQKGEKSKLEKAEKKLLDDFFILWFAMRHTTGSSWICGDEKLGMEPEMDDESYPLYQKVSLPRMVLAQFDSITHSTILKEKGKSVLKGLEDLMTQTSPQFFFTIYACSFILLHEASRMSKDRYRHARENHGKHVRYSLPYFVQELQKSCNGILHHWHYYQCKPFPGPNEPQERNKSMLVDLSEEQFRLVSDTQNDRHVQRHLAIWEQSRKNNGKVDTPPREVPLAGDTAYVGSQVRYDWDDPFYWISQMFASGWRPFPTYQAETFERTI